MGKPTIRSGRFTAGAFLTCGDNVVIDVAEEVTVGDRCVLADNTYLGGRRVTLGDDFFGYQWPHSSLDVGRGRRDEADAVLRVGSRCTFHDARIDLARRVTVGDDVGLSPEVVLYNHYYWLSILDGYPCSYDPIELCTGVIVGFRSVLLPGAWVGRGAVVGAQSVVSGRLDSDAVYAGNPARKVRDVVPLPPNIREMVLIQLLREYAESCAYRGFTVAYRIDFPRVLLGGCEFDCQRLAVAGDEDEVTDDWRDYAFRRGLRFYTQRPFRKIGRAQP